MKDRAQELVEEIQQITAQYKAEVPGRKHTWPKSIKDRVIELFDLGLNPKRVSDLTGISYHTVALWKSQLKGKTKFHPVKIVDSQTATTNSLATVTVTKRRGRPPKLVPQASNAAEKLTVTVTTPDGFRIEGLSVVEVMNWFRGA